MVQYVYYEHITSHARKCTRFSEIYLLFDLIIDYKVMTEKKKADFKAVRILETLLQKQGKAINHYSCIVKSRDTSEISPTRRPRLIKHRRTRN